MHWLRLWRDEQVGLPRGFVHTAAVCLWPRGKESGFFKRLDLAAQEWKNYRWAGIGVFLIWLCTAGFTFYNTRMLNPTVSGDEQERRQIRYEKEYKRFQGFPQPRIYDTKYDIRMPDRAPIGSSFIN